METNVLVEPALELMSRKQNIFYSDPIRTNISEIDRYPLLLNPVWSEQFVKLW